MLVLRCPTWQWQAGDPANARPFLPPDKQYLFTRNVPCQRRAASLMSGADDEQEVDGGDDEEGWLSAHASHVAKAAHDEEVLDMIDATSAMGDCSLGAASSSAAAAAEDGLEELGVEPEDPSALPSSTAGSNIVRTRTSHGAGLHASIHPCKHASVMHKLCSEIASSGREVRAEQYLFLFLKFISCVIPTVEYDHTISVDGL